MNNTFINSVNSIPCPTSPAFTNIKNKIRSYNNDGVTHMDETEKSNTIQYEYGNNIVSVERQFTNNTRINELLKNYIEEQQRTFFLHNSSKKCYNSQSSTTVVDFSGRRNK